MERLQNLEKIVRDLYRQQNPNRADWADWLADNHVFVVADYAADLAKKYGANEELSRAAALLHDIADVKMKRSDESHEQESLRMARELLQQTGYTADEIALVVDDAIANHSCRGDVRPRSLEGKALATADTLAHFKTDFFIYATWAFGREKSLDEVKEWAVKKLEKEINNKVFFDDERRDVMSDYELLREIFSR